MLQGSTVHSIELVVFILLLFVVVFAFVARKLRVPYPIVLVVAGLALSFVPGTPRVELEPEIVFVAVLPPLLYSGAWFASLRELYRNLVSVVLLAFGLVAFTVFAVAGGAALVLPGFDWRSGFVLGAVVATTDAIAATSIARRVGLPRQIADLLEGESLVNDATGLLALEFGIAMLASGQTPSPGFALTRLLYLTIAGVVVGLAVAMIFDWLHRFIDDAPIEITMTLLVPYASYLSAEKIGASGILAVVTSALVLSRRSSHHFSPRVRMEAAAVWKALTFILNGVIFVLIGLQLPWVLAGIRGRDVGGLIFDGLLFTGFLIVLRLLWEFPGAYLAWFIRARILRQDYDRPPAKAVFVVGWTGMRGVIALAAAMSLPATIGGVPFAQRNVIIFLAFVVIFMTLVVQGLTLGPLIRLLGLAGLEGSREAERAARRIQAEAALEHLRAVSREERMRYPDAYADLEDHYEARLAELSSPGRGQHWAAAEARHYRELSRELLGVERETALRMRREGEIDDDLLRRLQHELDLEEAGR